MEVPRRVTRCLNYKTGFSLIQKSGSLLVLPWQLILQSRVVSQNRDQQVWNHLMTPENSITIPWRFLLRPACRLWGLKVSVVCHVSVCDYPLLLFFCPPPPLLAAKNKFIKSQYIIKPALFVLRLSPLLYLLFNSEHFYIKKKKVKQFNEIWINSWTSNYNTLQSSSSYTLILPFSCFYV